MKQGEKILVITYYWPPAGGAGVQRWLKFCNYLPEFDIKPIVLTVDEEKASYLQTDETLVKDISLNIPVYKTNSFEPLGIFSSLVGKKNVPFGGFANVNKESVLQKGARFLRGNFFIPDPRKGWNSYAYKKALQLIKQENIKTIITTGPPHSTHLIGLKLQAKLGVKWICDMRDPWTDIYYYKDFMHLPFVKKMDAGLEKKVLEQADEIITVSAGFKSIFSAKSKLINQKKIHLLPNGYDEKDFTEKIDSKNKTYTLSYVGSMAQIYKPYVLLAAMANCLVKGYDMKLRFVGNVAPIIKKSISIKGLYKNVEYIDHVEHKKAISYMQNTNSLLLIIPNTSHAKGILPGKVFEYLAAQKPILAIGPTLGDVAEILKETKAGNIFDYDDEKGIEEELIKRINEFNSQEKTHQNVNIEQYSRRELTKKLASIIKA